MATSGTATYNSTRDQLVTTALQLLMCLGSGETALAADITFGSTILNMLVKNWEAFSAFLWKRQLGYVFLDASKMTYSLGNLNTDDNWTDSYTTTTLTAATAVSASTISVTSIAGILNTQNIGIVNNDGTIFWTTVNGAPSGTTVTLTAGNPVAVNSGARIYTYTSKSMRPLKIVKAMRRTYTAPTTFNDVKIDKVSLDQYSERTNKQLQGQILEFFYSRTMTSGTLYTWPLSNTGNSILLVVYDQPLQDFSASGDSPDFPQEWLLPLACNLALFMAPAFGITGADELAAIKMLAETSLVLARNNDEDDESTTIAPDTRRRSQ